MQLVARKAAHNWHSVLISQASVLIICAVMPHLRGPQLLLWACTAAALQAPTPSRKSRITAKAATEGAEIPYELCCQALHDDEAARLAAPPEDILKARYSAYVERKPDFIIDTTHPSNDE